MYRRSRTLGLGLVIGLVLFTSILGFAQIKLAATVTPTATVTFTVSGSFSVPSVIAFSPVGACQPGPSPTFPACPLSLSPVLGQPFTVSIPTSGLTAPITCTLVSGSSLPTWATLTVSGTSCVVSGTPNAAGPALTFTLTATGS